MDVDYINNLCEKGLEAAGKAYRKAGYNSAEENIATALEQLFFIIKEIVNKPPEKINLA